MFKTILSKNTLTSTLCNKFKGPARKMCTMENDVIIENVKDIGVLTLNRPKALNSLNLSMVKKILPTLQQWEKEKNIVIVKGSGDKAFCAGGDVKSLAIAGLKGEKLGEEFFKYEYTMNGVIGNYRIPYIAIIDGITMGGGVGMSVHGKYRIATERTLFAMPETAIGLFPDVGGTFFLPQLKGKLGLYLALTGNRLKGSDVLQAGIATHLVDSKCLPNMMNDLLGCKNQTDIDNVLKQWSTIPKEFSLAPHLEKINLYFNGKTLEDIFKNLDQDKSEWAQNTIKTLSKMSPTSMKVTKRALEESRGKDLLECLRMEYRIACHTLARKEFYEGVRALLIDKDQKPKWNPDKIEDVTDSQVEEFFTPLPKEQELKHKL